MLSFLNLPSSCIYGKFSLFSNYAPQSALFLYVKWSFVNYKQIFLIVWMSAMSYMICGSNIFNFLYGNNLKFTKKIVRIIQRASDPYPRFTYCHHFDPFVFAFSFSVCTLFFFYFLKSFFAYITAHPECFSVYDLTFLKKPVPFLNRIFFFLGLSEVSL